MELTESFFWIQVSMFFQIWPSPSISFNQNSCGVFRRHIALCHTLLFSDKSLLGNLNFSTSKQLKWKEKSNALIASKVTHLRGYTLSSTIGLPWRLSVQLSAFKKELYFAVKLKWPQHCVRWHAVVWGWGNRASFWKKRISQGIWILCHQQQSDSTVPKLCGMCQWRGHSRRHNMLVCRRSVKKECWGPGCPIAGFLQRKP